MCHTVTRDRRDAPDPLGRPRPRCRPAGDRPRSGGAGVPGRRPPGGRRRPGEAAGRRRCPRRPHRDLAAVVGPDHVLTDDETRRLRTRGKSTPDLLRARAGDLTDAPDAVVRPGDADQVQAVLEVAGRAPGRGGALRRRYVGHRRPRRAPRGVRRRAQPRPGPDEAAARRRPGLDDRHPRARPARPRGRGAPRRARDDPRPLPPVVRVRHDRRLRRDPLQRPVVGRLRPLRRPGDRTRGRHPGRPCRPRARARQRRRARPPAALPRLGGRARRDHVGDRARASASRAAGLRGLALAVLRRRHGRDPSARPGPAAADRAAALRRVRDGDQPGRPRRGGRWRRPGAA